MSVLTCWWHLHDKILNLPIPFFSLVPVSTPVIEKYPSYAVVEDKANVTLTCSVARGTRVVFQWLRDNVPLGPRERYRFSHNNSVLFISPVRKEDKGTYRCVVSNRISRAQSSRPMELNVYCELISVFSFFLSSILPIRYINHMENVCKLRTHSHHTFIMPFDWGGTI